MPPEIGDVVGSTPIEAEWGNDIRDRAVMRYASVAERNSLNPNPEPGEVCYRADAGVIEYFHGAAWRRFFPPGIIMPFGGTNAPEGFLLCQGQAVSRSTYADLFAVIGTAFGAGDGSTTFNIPDFRGKYPFGTDTSGEGNSVGATFGSKNHTHSMGNHTHGVGSIAGASAGSHTHSVSGNTQNTAVAHTHSLGGSTGNSSPGTSSAGSHSHSTGQGGGTSPSVAQGALGNSGPTHTHSVSSGGSHSHTVNSHSHSLPSNTGSTSSSTNHNHAVSITSGSAGSHTHSMSGSTASGGAGSTGSNNPPSLAVNFMISY